MGLRATGLLLLAQMARLGRASCVSPDERSPEEIEDSMAAVSKDPIIVDWRKRQRGAGPTGSDDQDQIRAPYAPLPFCPHHHGRSGRRLWTCGVAYWRVARGLAPNLYFLDTR